MCGTWMCCIPDKLVGPGQPLGTLLTSQHCHEDW